MKTKLFVLTCFLLVGFASLGHADEIALGEAAEQQGKSRDALSHYVAALQTTIEGSAEDQRLREKIIGLVQKLNPPPAIPEEADRHLARGAAALKDAENGKDYKDAIEEFKETLRLCPWLGEAYFNLGLVQDKAGQYDDAIRSLQFYLSAAPNAPDLKKVRSLIFEIEYRKEKAIRKVEEEAAVVASQPKPEILSVDLPETIPADGKDVGGTVSFKDNQGDIDEIRFDVVQASKFTPFRFKPAYVKGQASGRISFNVQSGVRQLVTLKATLIDEAGNHSNSVTFTFEAL